jgi:hypothetical protein
MKAQSDREPQPLKIHFGHMLLEVFGPVIEWLRICFAYSRLWGMGKHGLGLIGGKTRVLLRAIYSSPKLLPKQNIKTHGQLMRTGSYSRFVLGQVDPGIEID